MRKESFPRTGRAFAALAGLAALALLATPRPTAAQTQPIDDISGEYQFVSPGDTLALLDEDGKLKGYIDVIQGENESDAVLTYGISIGSRQKDHVELKTRKIHEKYYRFSGQAERGSGKGETNPDYLRLTGELETITLNPTTGQESVERQKVVFKSKGKEDEP